MRYLPVLKPFSELGLQEIVKENVSLPDCEQTQNVLAKSNFSEIWNIVNFLKRVYIVQENRRFKQRFYSILHSIIFIELGEGLGE